MTKDELKVAMLKAFGENPPNAGATLLTAENLLHGFGNVVEKMVLEKVFLSLDDRYCFQRQIGDRIREAFK